MPLDDASLPAYVRGLGLLPAGQELRVEPAGDGNINYVRRVRASGGRSLVVKHARPRLERFPEYAATPERIVFEYRFGEVLRRLAPEAARLLPQVLHFDPSGYVLVMEDLGDAPRLDHALARGGVEPAALHRLGLFLGQVRAATAGEAPALVDAFKNDEMRALHGEHIFSLPFEPNDFPLAPAVRELAERELARPGVRERIRELRHLYYESAGALVHGDVQAGNVLLQGSVPRLLDAEIAHVGDPAFDLGTALAHLRFHRLRAPQDRQLEDVERALLEGYREAGGPATELERAGSYAAVELLRRTLGAARVPWVEHESDACRALRAAVEQLAS